MELNTLTLRFSVLLPGLCRTTPTARAESKKNTKNSKLLQNTVTKPHAKQVIYFLNSVRTLVAIKCHFGPVKDTDLSRKSRPETACGGVSS